MGGKGRRDRKGEERKRTERRRRKRGEEKEKRERRRRKGVETADRRGKDVWKEGQQDHSLLEVRRTYETRKTRS